MKEIKCPKCSHVINLVKKCKRCGKTWETQKKLNPVCCARCKSIHWNTFGKKHCTELCSTPNSKMCDNCVDGSNYS